MRRSSIQNILLFLLATAVGIAQEKPTPATKPAQDPRVLGVAGPDTLFKGAAKDSTAKPTQGLPKFDLPEYIITGVETFDLPDAEKLDGPEPSHDIQLADPFSVPRDRSTVASESVERLMVIPQDVLTGRLEASSGTYFTSKLGLLISKLSPGYFYAGDAGYCVSKEYIPFTNRSGGHVNVIGGMTLRGPSEWYDGGKVKGEAGYSNESYRFYGSLSPSVVRSLSRFRLEGSYESPRDLLFNYNLRASLRVTSVGDSGNSVAETQFRFGVRSNVLVDAFPVDGRIDISFASISGSGSPTLPYVEASLMTPKHWFGGFFVQGSTHLYVTQGMLSQKFARFYPHIEIGYRILEGTILSASYVGGVQFNTLADLIVERPYLSAKSTIRQSDIPLNLIAALETDWSEIWRTRISARFQSVHDYPMITEGGGALAHKGIWMTDYLGTTSIATYQAELFAKFDANSYFSLSLEANSSKNSTTQLQVPYLPEFRLRSGLSLQVARGWQVHPTFAYVGRRAADLNVTTKLDEFSVFGVRSEYTVWKSFDVFIDLQNLTNYRYSEWNGYRASPFVLTGGIGYRW
jgi:hypothetical protein